MRTSTLLYGLLALFITTTTAAADTTDTAKDYTAKDDTTRATFGGGCFWCMEPPFDKLDGVLSTTSGYAGGHVDSPTYEQVSAGGTGHVEVVQVEYDPDKISYQELLDVYWVNTDPTDPDGQFCDQGASYRPVIFYHNEEQKQLAEASKLSLEKNKPFAGPITTSIEPLNDNFWPAEDYHQDYYKKNSVRYKLYRYSCGRDGRLEELWGEK